VYTGGSQHSVATCTQFVIYDRLSFPLSKIVRAQRCRSTGTGWTKMSLRMEVGLGLDDFVFDGDDPAPRKRTQPPPNFWPMFIVAKRQNG